MIANPTGNQHANPVRVAAVSSWIRATLILLASRCPHECWWVCWLQMHRMERWTHWPAALVGASAQQGCPCHRLGYCLLQLSGLHAVDWPDNFWWPRILSKLLAAQAYLRLKPFCRLDENVIGCKCRMFFQGKLQRCAITTISLHRHGSWPLYSLGMKGRIAFSLPDGSTRA